MISSLNCFRCNVKQLLFWPRFPVCVLNNNIDQTSEHAEFVGAVLTVGKCFRHVPLTLWPSLPDLCRLYSRPLVQRACA